MLIRLHHQVSVFLNRFHSLGLLVLRLTIAIIFIQTGWGKLNHLDQTTQYFIQLGLPFPYVNALMASATELLAGLGILVGLLIRPAALGIIGVMAVAIATAQWADVHDLNGFVGLQEWDYIVMAFVLVVFGAGKYSLEHILLKTVAK